MTVPIIINGRDLEITPRLREYVEKKAGRLDRYIDTITDAHVELAEIRSARSAYHRHVAEMTLRGRGGMILRAEERTEDVFAAIDAVMDKIERQIERFKGKHWDPRANSGPLGVQAVAAEEPVETGETPAEAAPARVVRRKRFALTPMSEDEAIVQMDLLGHDRFFLFYNVDTDAVNLLYRRDDGQYGLIEPEIG